MKRRFLIGALFLSVIFLLTACTPHLANTHSKIEVVDVVAASTTPAYTQVISTLPESNAVRHGEVIKADVVKTNADILNLGAPNADIPDLGIPNFERLRLSAANPQANDSSFIVYFIDVGQADSALIICDGAVMLIDGGTAADSSLIYSFLKNRKIIHIDCIIATHPHEDHVGGLSGALNYSSATVALSPATDYESKAFKNFIKYLGQKNIPINVPKHGDSFKLGSAVVKIIGPVKNYETPNNSSIVIKVSYGETSFLFTGDAEREEEQDILECGYDLSATVLKIGHHGSDSSTTYPFLREIMPKYAVISCGNDNSYGHPQENLLSRLRDADVTVFRTDMQGTITCTSDGNAVSFSSERNFDVQTNPTVSTSKMRAITTELRSNTSKTSSDNLPQKSQPSKNNSDYIGNVNSMKFHTSSCRSLPLEHNRAYFNTRDDAVGSGYSPCKICNP